MSHVIRASGALILAVTAWILLVNPALAALTTNELSSPSTPSLVAIVDNDAMLATDAETKMVDVDPSSAETERVYFELTFGASLQDDANPRPLLDRFLTSPVDRSATETAKPEGVTGLNYGQTVVLLGPLADAIRTCDDPSIAISRDVDYSSLTDFEKTAVLNYLTGRVNQEDTQEAGPSVGDEQPYDTPGDVAYSLRYTTLQPRVFYPLSPGNETIESDGSEIRTYNAYWSHFTCDFAGSGFWSEVNDQREFAYPQVTLTSSGASDQTVSKLQRTIQSVSTANSQRISTEGSSKELSGGIDEVDNEKTVWNSPLAQTSLSSVTVRYGDVIASQRGELLIFLGGVGISIVVASLVSVARSTVLVGLPALVDAIRRRKPRRRREEKQ